MAFPFSSGTTVPSSPFGVSSQASPVPSPSASAWSALDAAGQLSDASAILSPSPSNISSSPPPSSAETLTVLVTSGAGLPAASETL